MICKVKFESIKYMIDIKENGSIIDSQNIMIYLLVVNQPILTKYNHHQRQIVH